MNNRIYKFRAWDIDHKQFIYFDLNDPDENLFGRHGVLENGGFEPWQQFTGLKDYQGTEIYEGDVVQSMICPKGVYLPLVYKTVVEWRTAPLYNGYTIQSGKLKKVIGNIWENPELSRQL